MAPYQGELTQTLTDSAFCSGCGSCEHACPVEGDKAIYVSGHREHRIRKEKPPAPESDEPGEPPEEELEEFPF
ncbi:4Fe-4S binding protein [Marispirochaeta sp.]|uniref:4Fe-4S binding protein n=1 Tax=Marispirochaeta sp. TaxID=2038653 RepID=UPI0029C8D5D3|nr:4Fe-4S binding protein [Marispirochaeta sp.]